MTETRPLSAAAAMIAAMTIIGLIDNFVVTIAESHGLWQFHIVRTALALPLIAVLGALGLGTIRPNRTWAVCLRSSLIATAMMIYFGSLAFLPIAEVAAGLFSSPLWVLVISLLSGHERIGPVRGVAALSGFAGVMMVLRPDTGEFTPLSLVPLSAGFFYALGVLTTRAACRDETTNSLLAGNFLFLALFAAVGLGAVSLLDPEVLPGPDGFITRGWLAFSGEFLFWVTVQAVGSIVGVWLLIRSYQWGEASFSATFEYSLLISVSFWAWLLRGETLDGWAAAGIALIVTSGAAIAFRGR